MMGIYKITNIINNKCYIGLSNNLHKRIEHHKYTLINNQHYNEYLQRSVNKYGIDNFTFEILFKKEFIDRNNLNLLEQTFISIFNSFKEGYNQTSGGDSALEISNETKLKMSKSCFERKMWKENKSILYRESIKKPIKVINLETNEEYKFKSILEACKYFNVHSRKVYRVLKGIRKSTKGLRFEYLPILN